METLKHRGQFERVRREGRTWATGLVVLNAAPNGLDVVRCGFVAGKKTGNAVKRNRGRRLIREAVRLKLPQIKLGWDLVWIARQPVVEASFEAVDRAVEDALSRARLLLVAAPIRETGEAQSRIIVDTMDGASATQAPAARPEIAPARVTTGESAAQPAIAGTGTGEGAPAPGAARENTSDNAAAVNQEQ